MGLSEVITIIFVICKLTGVIEWSWWFVFLLEIISVVIYALVFILGWVSTIRECKNVSKQFRHFK